MDINTWTLLWKACLIGTLGIFAIMAIVVTIGGAYDVVQLLKSLRKRDESQIEQK